MNLLDDPEIGGIIVTTRRVTDRTPATDEPSAGEP